MMTDASRKNRLSARPSSTACTAPRAARNNGASGTSDSNSPIPSADTAPTNAPVTPNPPTTSATPTIRRTTACAMKYQPNQPKYASPWSSPPVNVSGADRNSATPSNTTEPTGSDSAAAMNGDATTI